MEEHQVRASKPVFSEFLADLLREQEAETDARRRHLLEILIAGYNHLIRNEREGDISRPEADVLRGELGIKTP